MKRLLIYDFFRGPDSTGFAALRRNGDTYLAKVASHPLDLFDMKTFDKAMSGYNSTVFLGHNRLATKGKVNGGNAHPFQYGHIIGAHNGTLDVDSWKRLNEVVGYDTDVDSQAIFACIEKIGIEETVALMTEGRTSSEGAWALTWIDLKENTLNFLRNQWRPLWYTYTDDFKKVLWASEWPMIRASTDLSATSYKLHEDKEGYNFWEIPKDWWYRFDLEELKGGSKSRPKPRVKEVKGREPPKATPSTTGGRPFTGTPWYKEEGNVTTMGTPNGKTTTTGSTGTSADKPLSLIEFRGSDTLPLGVYMDEDQFSAYNKYGCSWCQAEVPFNEKGITVYEMTGHILCSKCSGHGDRTRIYTNVHEIESFEKVLKDQDPCALVAVA